MKKINAKEKDDLEVEPESKSKKKIKAKEKENLEVEPESKSKKKIKAKEKENLEVEPESKSKIVKKIKEKEEENLEVKLELKSKIMKKIKAKEKENLEVESKSKEKVKEEKEKDSDERGSPRSCGTPLSDDFEEDTPSPESQTKIPTELRSSSKSARASGSADSDNDEEGRSFFLLKGPRIDPEKGYRVDVDEDRDDSPDVESSSVSSASSWNSADEGMKQSLMKSEMVPMMLAVGSSSGVSMLPTFQMVNIEQSEEPTPEEAAEKERRAKRDVIKLKKMIQKDECQQM